MTETTIYTIPGLGFDKRIFSHLNIFKNEIQHLEWLDPKPNEPIDKYAYRMAKNFKQEPQNCIVIGHSFGGIMAQEIAAHIPIKKIILISSIKSKKEKPYNFKMVAPLGLHQFFSKNMTLRTFDYWGKKFGYETAELQNLFKDMIAQQSDNYLKWALYQLSIWQGVEKNNTALVHIHGRLDKTFPIKWIGQPVIEVEEGSHMMIFEKAALMNKLIQENLKI